jgi:hypothetical protein
MAAGTTASTTASTKASANNQDHAARLHDKYLALDFKSNPNDPQDLRREGLFKRLVLHHLLQHLTHISTDWDNEANRDKYTSNFFDAYARLLWPSFRVERHHLRVAQISSVRRNVRSWIGGWDGRSPGGGLGRSFKAYVDVLLEGGLVGAVVEDPAALIAGITSLEVGDEIPAAVTIKAGDVSESDVVVEAGVVEDEDVIMGGC